MVVTKRPNLKKPGLAKRVGKVGVAVGLSAAVLAGGTKVGKTQPRYDRMYDLEVLSGKVEPISLTLARSFGVRDLQLRQLEAEKKEIENALAYGYGRMSEAVFEKLILTNTSDLPNILHKLINEWIAADRAGTKIYLNWWHDFSRFTDRGKGKFVPNYSEFNKYLNSIGDPKARAIFIAKFARELMVPGKSSLNIANDILSSKMDFKFKLPLLFAHFENYHPYLSSKEKDEWYRLFRKLQKDYFGPSSNYPDLVKRYNDYIMRYMGWVG